MKNFDGYYDPPEEPETPICEECGQDERVKLDFSGKIDFTFCDNLMCPGKFEVGSIEREMAEKLVEALDTVSELKLKVRLLNNMLNA